MKRSRRSSRDSRPSITIDESDDECSPVHSERSTPRKPARQLRIEDAPWSSPGKEKVPLLSLEHEKLRTRKSEEEDASADVDETAADTDDDNDTDNDGLCANTEKMDDIGNYRRKRLRSRWTAPHFLRKPPDVRVKSKTKSNVPGIHHLHRFRDIGTSRTCSQSVYAPYRND